MTTVSDFYFGFTAFRVTAESGFLSISEILLASMHHAGAHSLTMMVRHCLTVPLVKAILMCAN